jgi:galactokinase
LLSIPVSSESLAARFIRIYQKEARIFCAPGRINLIGDHTDYNGGFVMPIAIDRETHVAAAEGMDGWIEVHSETFEEQKIFALDDASPVLSGQWSEYVRGVALMIRKQGYALRGTNLIVHSNIPPGAGLSSSAALEVGCALALLGIAGVHPDLIEIALLCQRAENEFIGAKTGIMDQFASCHGRAGHAIFLDCRSLSHRYIPIPDRLRLLICDTRVRHELASGEYNVRRQQCEEAVRILSHFLPVSTLRDVKLSDLIQYRGHLGDVLYRRCRHVIQENERTHRAAEALVSGDLQTVGALVNDSHASLRDLYEVSCPELDLMATLARSCNGVYGSRMTGGGFGGCTVSLVNAADADAAGEVISRAYYARTGIRGDIRICTAVGGAAEENVD